MDSDGLPSCYAMKVAACLGKWQLKMHDLGNMMDPNNQAMKPFPGFCRMKSIEKHGKFGLFIYCWMGITIYYILYNIYYRKGLNHPHHWNCVLASDKNYLLFCQLYIIYYNIIYTDGPKQSYPKFYALHIAGVAMHPPQACPESIQLVWTDGQDCRLHSRLQFHWYCRRFQYSAACLKLD